MPKENMPDYFSLPFSIKKAEWKEFIVEKFSEEEREKQIKQSEEIISHSWTWLGIKK